MQTTKLKLFKFSLFIMYVKIIYVFDSKINLRFLECFFFAMRSRCYNLSLLTLICFIEGDLFYILQNNVSLLLCYDNQGFRVS